MQKEIYNLLQAIDVSAINPGTYLISVVSNDFSAKQKIIIN
ncbi:T9SS type A sorting domain-containing protein [uncultured Draconibacterium sp.]